MDEIPVVNLYKFEQERYGNSVRRFLSFKNNEGHKLGETPIPGGSMKVYGTVVDGASSSVGMGEKHSSTQDAQGKEQRQSLIQNGAGSSVYGMRYISASSFKYIPLDEEVELDLGHVKNVIVEPTLMKLATDKYKFDHKGNIIGWDDIHDYKIEVRNTRSVPVKIEIKRNFNTAYWDLTKAGDHGKFEKDDMDTVKFTLELPPESKKEFTYQLTTYHGVNQEGK